MKAFYSTLFFSFCFTVLSAQLVHNEYEEWSVKFHQTSEDYSAVHFFENHRNNMGLTENDEMVLHTSNIGIDGLEHRKYQQYYKGIRVYGSSYTLHGDTKSISHSSGYYIPNISLETDGHYSEDRVLRKLKSLFVYKNHLSLDDLNNQMEIEKVIIDKAFPNISRNIVLAYKVDIFNKKRTLGTRYLVDAHQHSIITELPLICNHSVPAKGQSTVYGDVDIIVDSIASNQYKMVDSTRGESIETYIDVLYNVAENDDKYWELPAGEDYNVAVDAHYCTSKFYDMMLEKYQWNGLDNNGKSFRSIVYENSSGDFVNAFWNGTNAAFGNGDCHRGPLTTLEVVGHEFMHGITDYTSDLIYKGESGAINESMSDVFGKMLEYTYDIEEFDWQIGQSFLLDTYTQSFRSMSNPNSRNMPDTYKGEFWNDNAGVHTNSAVGNHFFYRLVEGGSGVTEKGESFDFQGIGMEQASKLIFNVQSNYLVTNSTYPDYHAFCLVSAKQLFGEESKEYAAVVEAWKVVGLPYDGGAKDKKDLAVNIPSNILNTCISSNYYTLPMTITNVGKGVYAKGTTFEIKLSLSGQTKTYEYELENDLQENDVMSIEINDFLYLDEAKNYYISVTLQIDDFDQNNNSTFFYIKNKVILDNNLALQNPNVQFKHCKGNTIKTTIRVKNESCNDFIATAPVNLRWVNAATEKVFHEHQFVFNTVLFSENSHSEIVEVDYTNIDSFYMEMISDDDVTNDNNKSVLTFPPTDILIKDAYFTDFSSEKPFKHLHLSSLNNIGYLNKDGVDYLWSSALYSNSSGSICQFPKDNIGNGRYGTNSEFSTCLDLSENSSPFLKFSLTQYRSQNLDQFPSAVQSNSAICKVEYFVDDEVVFEKIISNQEIGKEVTYIEPLPANSNGVLYFRFYNHQGSFSLFSPDLDNQLISEFEIGQYNTTEEKELITNFAFPNPTSGEIHINQFYQFTEYELFDVSGRKRVLLNDNGIMDISHLEAGIYFLKAYYNKKHSGTQKVILLK